jgi:glycosyltransferase involved in cell wall biosynthesis
VSERLLVLGADERRITMVGHGIDTEVFRPDVSPAQADGPYFVYTGTMSEVHAPHVLVRAFATLAAEVPGVRLKFFGQGVYESELRALADELAPGRVDFGGVVPPDETAAWIRGAVAALVSLAPGLGYDYAHPTKAYAAAACGTPVLYTGAESFGDIVDRAGLGIAASLDTDAVAAAMRRLLTAASDGETERLRAARASWAVANVSLAAVGERAAEAVRDLVNPAQAAK